MSVSTNRKFLFRPVLAVAETPLLPCSYIAKVHTSSVVYFVKIITFGISVEHKIYISYS